MENPSNNPHVATIIRCLDEATLKLRQNRAKENKRNEPLTDKPFARLLKGEQE